MNFFTDAHETSEYPLESAHPPQYEGQIPSVSFSTLTNFENCQYQVYLSKHKGIENVGSPAMDRGTTLHAMLEDYVKGNIEMTDKHWRQMKAGTFHQELIDSFKRAYQDGLGHTELRFAFTVNMEPCDWDSPDVWLRGAIDFTQFSQDGTHADAYDYKSGSSKSTAKHRSQLVLYMIVLFFLYPKLQTVSCAPVYLDEKVDLFMNRFTRKDAEGLWPRYYARLRQVTDCRLFSPNPTFMNCRWCQHARVQEALGQTEPACHHAASRY